MKLLQTTTISNFPDDVIVGYSEILDGLSESVLSEKEHEEWSKFNNINRKNEFITTRHLFRMMLEEAGKPNTFEIQKSDSGKPFAKSNDSKLFVSFSHTNSAVFCAISSIHDIGLDSEPLDRKIDSRIVKRILNEKEWRQFENENPILLWTIKEATVKSMGTGLRTNLNELCIAKNEKERFIVRFNDEKTFQICSFQKMNHQLSIAY